MQAIHSLPSSDTEYCHFPLNPFTNTLAFIIHAFAGKHKDIESILRFLHQHPFDIDRFNFKVCLPVLDSILIPDVEVIDI